MWQAAPAGWTRTNNVSASKSTRTSTTRELTFTITAETKILQGETAKTFADIKEGDTVTIVYAREGENRIASKVTLAAPAPAAPPAPTK